MGAVTAWIILIVAVLALVLPPCWLAVPVAQAARTWVLDPTDGERLRRSGISAMRRGLTGLPFVVGGSLLMHYLWREAFSKTDLVNHEIVGASAMAGGIVYLIAVHHEKHGGGRA